MKKTKFFINIITICFCIGALMIGVYSLKYASLGISGEVGFIKHGQTTRESYLAANWKALVCTDVGDSTVGFCQTTEIATISFVNKLPTDVTFIKDNETNKVIYVGANDEKSIRPTTIESGIEDVSVYASGNTTAGVNLYFYSSSKIYIGFGYNLEYSELIGEQFSSLTSLTSISFDNADTSKVTDMSGMFNVCSSLETLDLSGFDTSNVTIMSGMFTECTSLTELNLSGFDTSKVTSTGSMFTFCSSIVELDLTSFDTSNVTDMGFMFAYCEVLEVIKISTLWSIESVEYGDEVFSGCAALVGENYYGDGDYVDAVPEEDGGRLTLVS